MRGPGGTIPHSADVTEELLTSKKDLIAGKLGKWPTHVPKTLAT